MNFYGTEIKPSFGRLFYLSSCYYQIMTELMPNTDDDFLGKPLFDLGSGVLVSYYGVGDNYYTEKNLEIGNNRVGIHYTHPGKDKPRCIGSAMFDLPVTERFNNAKWQVEQWEPLTISPSLLCKRPVAIMVLLKTVNGYQHK